MYLVAELPFSAIVGAVSTFLMAVVGLITYIAKAIFEYLIARIKTLETREQTVLTGAVDSIEHMNESLKSTAEFVLVLAEEQRYQERKRREGEAKP